MADGQIKLDSDPVFVGIDPIKYEGPGSDNPLAYRYYNKDQVVFGKRMEDHLRMAVCYWHTFCWDGYDIFGAGTFDRPWHNAANDRAAADATFASMGAAHNRDPNARHPNMHKTDSLDYIILLQGEVTLILDEGEVDMKALDVVVQRGTNHAWSNRSDKPCEVMFVLIDGSFDPDLAAKFPTE